MASQASVDVVGTQADNCQNHTGTASARSTGVTDSEEGVNAAVGFGRDSAAREPGGSMRCLMGVWKEKALRERLRPKTWTELVRQSCRMDIATAIVGLRQNGADRVPAVGLERTGSEVREKCRPDTGDVLQAAYTAVTEARVLRRWYTVVVARCSKPRGWMAGVSCSGVAVDLWHLRITFESSAEIYSHWNGAGRPPSWRWRTGMNTEAVGRNTWRTG